MYTKKKIALIAAVVCCAVAVGGSAYYGIVRNYSAPKINESAEMPPVTTPKTTQPPIYTDPPVEETAIQEGNLADAVSEVAESPTVAEVTQSATVSDALPRPHYFELPLGLDIILDYSAAEPVFNATMGDWRTHKGVDFAGVTGDPIKASAAGFVTAVYDDPMYGTVMEIDHGGGVTAKYCGLGRGSTIPVGTEVKTNDTIGYLGAVPCEADAGAHLHMEMRENGETVDPLILFELS